ncbi:hypothetical protein B9Z55_000713 [Caenorhabditis nigoni]|uniref:Uncharacterized protein n=1 Tax=Caenorhabditis nigoni TaxID=1611254 RepID=A0A2G5VUE9_9PELO|nr:hypothetical protein B9Z55_000713 [Caenorhabditis nigoni]
MLSLLPHKPSFTRICEGLEKVERCDVAARRMKRSWWSKKFASVPSTPTTKHPKLQTAPAAAPAPAATISATPASSFTPSTL